MIAVSGSKIVDGGDDSHLDDSKSVGSAGSDGNGGGYNNSDRA